MHVGREQWTKAMPHANGDSLEVDETVSEFSYVNTYFQYLSIIRAHFSMTKCSEG